MKKFIVLTLFLALFLTGCSLTGQKQETLKPATRTVDIKNQVFMPSTLSIKKGDTVIWTNQDMVQHSITADKFSSEDLTPGKSYSFTFKKSGTFTYACGIHSDIKGSIIVSE